ncbi:MAG: hypothetical protein RL514_2625 [Verrucomicrobiota bacterium]|jgi:P4 family phage/plasmid primase-like protien
MNQSTDSFRAAMRDAGLDYAGALVADGKLHRFKAAGDKARNSWFILFPGTPTAGAFGCWKRGVAEKWCERKGQLSPAEQADVRRRWQEAERERARTEKERHAQARKTAPWILDHSAAAIVGHPYLAAKGVQPHGGLRQRRGALVLPLRDASGALHSLQFIGADGQKRFLKGGRVAGCFFSFADEPEGPLVVCEGYATGASIHEATGFATVCAMNCGNLEAVAESLRAKWPARDIIIAADYDAFTKDKAGQPFNPGVEAATAAAQSIRARLAIPQFADASTQPTDFNDLHQLQGLDTVKTQIEAATPPAPAVTPALWFTDKFPAVSPDEFGGAIREETDREGAVVVKDIGEDFLAATLGEKGNPTAPTVFMPNEDKFYTYAPADGVFVHQREAALVARQSRLLLDCHHACKHACDTKALEYRFRDAASLSGVLRKARGLLEVPHEFFASDLTEFIPCANGMLRLRDRTLLPFSPSYRRRNKLAAPYDPAAKCPLFLDTLMRAALADDDLELLQRWCGLALIGENMAQRILILTGTAGGGKGTFVRVLTGIIGQMNLASLRPQLLGERFELGRFLGKTLLYGADVPDNFLNHRGASVLKSLTGYDPTTLEFKGSNESPSITCRFNVLATCNSRLTVHLEGDTDAWRRRLAIIEYRKPKPEKVVADLDKVILQQEAAGVLNWMLNGLDRLRANGWQLHLNARQQAVVDNLLLESDSLAVFAREGLRRATSGRLTTPDGFAAYVEFCTEHGWAALPKNKFTSGIADVVVRQFGLTVRHDIPDAGGKLQRGWRGLALVTNFSAPTGENSSEVSETPSATAPPDTSDTFFQVQPGKISTSEPAEALLL